MNKAKRYQTLIPLILALILTLLLISLAASGAILIFCILYFKKQDSIIENVRNQITRFLSGQSGIHPEDIAHIFKRFYRSRFSKDTQGIGLGLPLARTIIEAHDGMIEVDSELRRGTAFSVNFLIPTEL